MSLQRIIIIVVFVVLESTRIWAIILRRKLPLVWGKDWFINVPVGPDFYQGPGADMLHRYRKQTLTPYIVEFVCLLPVFFFANYFYVLPAAIATSAMLMIWSNRILKSFIKEARPYAISDVIKPTVPVALSLTRRRFTAYLNPGVESAIILLTIAGITLFIRYYWYFNWEGNHTLSALLPLILYFYLQAGGLLLKHVLVRWRLTLPGEHTDQYFKIFEERRLALLRICDFFRLLCAVMLPFYLFDQLANDVFQWRYARTFHLAVGFLLIAAALISANRYVRRMRGLIKQMDPSTLVKMQRRVADKPTSFGGYAYFDADNPSVLVRTSGGLVLNFANKRVYLYGLYLIGLVALVTVVHFY